MMAIPVHDKKVNDWVTKLLRANGIDKSQVNRVVLDIRAGETVKMYVSRFGTGKTFDVVSTLNGIEIIEHEKPSDG